MIWYFNIWISNDGIGSWISFIRSFFPRFLFDFIPFRCVSSIRFVFYLPSFQTVHRLFFYHDYRLFLCLSLPLFLLPKCKRLFSIIYYSIKVFISHSIALKRFVVDRSIYMYVCCICYQSMSVRAYYGYRIHAKHILFYDCWISMVFHFTIHVRF